MTDYWNGQPVTILRRFSGVVTIADPRDKSGKSRLTLPETSINYGEKVTSTYPTPAPIPQLVAALDSPLDVTAPRIVPEEKIETAKRIKQMIDINNLIAGELEAAARSVPGIGKRTLEILVQNRPDTGYTDFEHLKELNKKDVWASIKWDALQGYFAFILD